MFARLALLRTCKMTSRPLHVWLLRCKAFDVIAALLLWITPAMYKGTRLLWLCSTHPLPNILPFSKRRDNGLMLHPSLFLQTNMTDIHESARLRPCAFLQSSGNGTV